MEGKREQQRRGCLKKRGFMRLSWRGKKSAGSVGIDFGILREQFLLSERVQRVLRDRSDERQTLLF